MNDIIVVKNLSKTYGNIKAVQNASFSIKSGEFLAIQGHSGAGKTILLSLLSGLERADEGEIVIGKERISSMSEEQLALFRRNNIGIVFQFFNLIPTLNVVENIALPLFPVRMSKREMLDKAKIAAEQVGLSKRLSHYPNELSGGEQQRVAIARALIANPKVIFADEPTGNLDSATGRKIIELLKDLNKVRHLTIVMVTHDNGIAKKAHRILRLKDGRVIHG
jgi:putative ABC transport system ATP-binding protein